MKRNVVERAAKTAVEAFFGVLIPQIVAIIGNIVDYNFADWRVWLLPIVSSALATAISAGWNAWQNNNSHGDQIE